MGSNSKTYEKDGKFYDRTTSILDAWVEPWRLEWLTEVGRVAANKKSRAALALGKRVDTLVQVEIEKGKFNLAKADSKEVASCMAGWKLWKEREAKGIISIQQTSYCDETMTAGTYDLEEGDAITDVKTSSQISPKHWLQVAWYNHISLLNKPYIAILRLDKFWSNYEYVRKPMNQGYCEIFKGILNAYRYFNHQGELE